MRRLARRRTRTTRFLVTLLALLALLAAGAAPAQDESESDRQRASLRVMHLSPDAPLVDVLVDGRLEVRDLGLRERSPILTLSAGRHEVRVYPHRLPTADEDVPAVAPADEAPLRADAAPPPGSDAPAEDTDGRGDAVQPDAAPPDDEQEPAPRTLEPVTAIVDLSPGTYTTLVLTGNFELPTQDARRGGLSLDVDPDDATVTVRGPQGFSVQRSGDQLIRDLEPGTYEAEVRREGYLAAAYEVEVPPAATAVVTVTLQEADGGEGSEPILAEPDAQGEWRRLELQPYTGDVPLAAPGTALVRVVHAAPQVPHLTVRWVPSAAVEDDVEGDEDARAGLPGPIERLAYPNASDYAELPAGAYDAAFGVAGSDSVLYDLPDVDLRAGVTYTLFVAAGSASGEIWIVPSVDAVVPQSHDGRGTPGW